MSKRVQVDRVAICYSLLLQEQRGVQSQECCYALGIAQRDIIYMAAPDNLHKSTVMLRKAVGAIKRICLLAHDVYVSPRDMRAGFVNVD